MREKNRTRARPALTVTLDAENVLWLRSWGEDLPLSRKIDAAVTFLREKLEAASSGVE